VLERIWRQVDSLLKSRLRAKGELSLERALAELRKTQRHKVRINKAAPISGISTINDTQAIVLESLNIKKPSQNALREVRPPLISRSFQRIN
jgi:hypothetical protein